jgi:hypothetical protein
MNAAIEIVAEKFDLDIKEFTVAGIPFGSLFAHHWFIGTDNPVDEHEVKLELDQTLKVLNDDYRVERTAALKEIIVDIMPSNIFYKWLKVQGKEGGQNKFPRVLKNKQLENWLGFIDYEKTESIIDGYYS